MLTKRESQVNDLCWKLIQEWDVRWHASTDISRNEHSQSDAPPNSHYVFSDLEIKFGSASWEYGNKASTMTSAACLSALYRSLSAIDNHPYVNCLRHSFTLADHIQYSPHALGIHVWISLSLTPFTVKKRCFSFPAPILWAYRTALHYAIIGNIMTTWCARLAILPSAYISWLRLQFDVSFMYELLPNVAK